MSLKNLILEPEGDEDLLQIHFTRLEVRLLKELFTSVLHDLSWAQPNEMETLKTIARKLAVRFPYKRKSKAKNI